MKTEEAFGCYKDGSWVRMPVCKHEDLGLDPPHQGRSGWELHTHSVKGRDRGLLGLVSY